MENPIEAPPKPDPLEQAENNIRKDFTPSEKVEIARRIEEAVGNRQGQRTELQQNVAEVKGKQTRDIAAEAIGWSGAAAGVEVPVRNATPSSKQYSLEHNLLRTVLAYTTLALECLLLSVPILFLSLTEQV